MPGRGPRLGRHESGRVSFRQDPGCSPSDHAGAGSKAQAPRKAFLIHTVSAKKPGQVRTPNTRPPLARSNRVSIVVWPPAWPQAALEMELLSGDGLNSGLIEWAGQGSNLRPWD